MVKVSAEGSLEIATDHLIVVKVAREDEVGALENVRMNTMERMVVI